MVQSEGQDRVYLLPSAKGTGLSYPSISLFIIKYSRAVLPVKVATNHMWLLKLIKMKQNEEFSSSLTLLHAQWLPGSAILLVYCVNGSP